MRPYKIVITHLESKVVSKQIFMSGMTGCPAPQISTTLPDCKIKSLYEWGVYCKGIASWQSYSRESTWSAKLMKSRLLQQSFEPPHRRLSEVCGVDSMVFPLLNRKSFYRSCRDSAAVSLVSFYTSNDGWYYLHQASYNPDIFRSGSSDLLRAYTSLGIFPTIQFFLTSMKIITWRVCLIKYQHFPEEAPDVYRLSCGLRACWPPSVLRILHAYNVITHRCNVNTAMDSCTKAGQSQKLII